MKSTAGHRPSQKMPRRTALSRLYNVVVVGPLSGGSRVILQCFGGSWLPLVSVGFASYNGLSLATSTCEYLFHKHLVLNYWLFRKGLQYNVCIKLCLVRTTRFVIIKLVLRSVVVLVTKVHLPKTAKMLAKCQICLQPKLSKFYQIMFVLWSSLN